MLRLIYLGVSGFLLVCNGTSDLTVPFFPIPLSDGCSSGE